MKKDENELLMAMADQVRLLGYQVTAQQAAIETLFRNLPPAAQKLCAADFREAVEVLFDQMDGMLQADKMQSDLALCVNAILEALGQSPGRKAR